MSEFKVRLVDDESKSRVQLEKELLDKAENERLAAEQEASNKEEETTEDHQDPIIDEDDIPEEKVLSFFKKKRGLEIESIDDIFKREEIAEQEELPEDVNAFLKYKKETGRGLKDFYRLNAEVDTTNEDSLLRSFYKETKPHLSDSEIEFKIRSSFAYDEDEDLEDTILSKQIAKKEALLDAEKYFTQMKEKYRAPLESNDGFVPEAEKETYKAFKNQIQRQSEIEQQNADKGRFFTEKTNELFSDKFEGFKFKIGENNEVSYKPEEASTLKEKQSNLQNFFNRFLDDKGYLKDAEAFHKAVAVANNPEQFAKFFYEKGQSDATTNIAKESKNLDVVRGVPGASQVTSGLKVRAIEDPDVGRVKIRKI
jgi:hypothetical protein